MLENGPLISVILTTYNRAHLLMNSVNSVLNNSYLNFELIIIDDASTDNTEDIANLIDDKRVKYYKFSINKGVLAARNQGFNICQGRYVLLLDDDDELVKNALEVVIDEFQKIENSQIDIIWFDCMDFESSRNSGYMPLKNNGIVSFDDYVCGEIYGDFWLAFKNTALDGMRFNENLRAHESLLWLKIHRNNNARYVKKVLCLKHREHGERLCDLNQRIKQIPQTTIALAEFINEFGEDVKKLCPKLYGQKLSYLGLHFFLINKFNDGRQNIIKSFYYKFSIKYVCLYFLSYILNDKQILWIYKKLN